MENESSVSTASLQLQATIRAGRRSSARASVWRKFFILQDDVSPALAPSGAISPKASLRARPEKDDKPEVKDEDLDPKGGDEPYD
jgi:hypothetical protein